MSLFLKQFSTHSEYDVYINGSDAILPNVSICTTEGDVHYNPYVDPYVGHEYVEIGGVKWATMNVGASSITDTGLYFQWGDTQGYTAAQVGTDKNFTWDDYKYTNDGGSTMSKYNSSDGKTTLEASDDALVANWGGSWRMPTTAEFQALGAAVNTAWTADYQGSGVSGLVCTDKTDSSKVLFFPAVGKCESGSVKNAGSHGFYWSSSFNINLQGSAYYLFFRSSSSYWYVGSNRSYGCAVRGVAD